jgi:GNAT superfamily N-acetyltransferase
MTAAVRIARPGDGAAILRVWLDAAAYHTELDPEHFKMPVTDDFAERTDEVFDRSGDDVLNLVAEMDGRVVGWLSARVAPPDQDAAAQFVREHDWTRLTVDALIVDRQQWRQGTGAKLLESAEAWGHARGAQVVRLDTWADSPVSIPFYEQHMGYQRRSIVFQKRLRS